MRPAPAAAACAAAAAQGLAQPSLPAARLLPPFARHPPHWHCCTSLPPTVPPLPRRPLGRLLRQATGGIQMSTAIAEGGPGSSARTFSTQAADGETASGFSTSSAKGERTGWAGARALCQGAPRWVQ